MTTQAKMQILQLQLPNDSRRRAAHEIEQNTVADHQVDAVTTDSFSSNSTCLEIVAKIKTMPWLAKISR